MRYITIISLFLFTGCLGPVKDLYPNDESERTIPVYVTSHGWHTGIVVESHYMRSYLPQHPELPEGRYLKFGWGDGRYYPHRDPGFGLLLRAALWPTESVLHVTAFDREAVDYFYTSDVVKILLSEQGMAGVAQFLADEFRLDNNGNLIFAETGLYGRSAFFIGKKKYFVPRTSNRWVARAVRSGGAPISPFYAITAGNVIKQTRSFGTLQSD